MRRDIDDALSGWTYEPEPGEVLAREVRARDGRNVVQIRVELGLLQMEITGRPDGLRPHGFVTYLDYLRHRAAGRGLSPGGKSPPWTMTEEQGSEADREFVQYHHRRVAWLSLERHDRALADADHTLALMDFLRRHGHSSDLITSQERLRGLVLFQRTRAAAALSLEKHRPGDAVEAVRDGIERLAEHRRVWEAEHEGDETPNGALLEQLQILESEIRKNFDVPLSLREQLAEAVSLEDYEKAARIRDQMRSSRKR